MSAKRDDIYLSYSGYKVADGCLFRWWNMYENNTKIEKEDDRLGSIYGSTVGQLFEAFYQLKMWRDKNVQKTLEDMAPGTLDKVLKEATTATDFRPAGVLGWQTDEDGKYPRGLYKDRDHILKDVLEAIPKGLQTIKAHAFIGKDAVAEMYLNTTIEGRKFGGRADFVMTRVKHGDFVILDGRGSRQKDKYIDDTQLYWYALLMREKHGKFPDWVGFIFWKFESPYNVIKHEVTHDKVDRLKNKVLTLMDKIEEGKKELGDEAKHVNLSVVQEVFKHEANEDNCRFCPYATPGVCRDGAEVVRKMEERYKNR